MRSERSSKDPKMNGKAKVDILENQDGKAPISRFIIAHFQDFKDNVRGENT